MSLQEVIGLTEQPRNLVSEFRRRLETQIGADCFELWFNAENSIVLNGTRLIVAATDEFSMDRIKSKYQNPISDLANQLGVEEVRFEVISDMQRQRSVMDTASLPADDKSKATSSADATDPESTRPRKPQRRWSAIHPQRATGKSVNQRSGGSASEEAGRDHAAGRAAQNDLTESERAKSERAKSDRAVDGNPQVTFSSGKFRRPRHELSDFIFDSQNEILWNACKQVICSPGELSPFFLFGKAGTGKSHLLEGIANAARRRGKAGRVRLVTAEQFTSDYIGSLKNRTMPMFRKRYRELDYLLIDDLQFFAGKSSTLEELQHTIEEVTRKGGQVIVSADRSPHELEFAGPEFIHRVACGLTTQIQPPSEATREKIVRQLADRKGVQLEEAAIGLLATEISGDARLIAGALNRLKLHQLINGQPVTADEARTHLADLIQISHRTVTLSDIENAVCELFGLEQKTLRSASKVKAVSQPRMLAMWLSRKYTRAALSEIGDYFGGRSHSTVLSAQSKVETWVEKREVIGLKHSALPVENAIRRIEQELRIG